MDALLASGRYGDVALLIGLSSTRAMVALLLVPVFAADLIPAIVRNALFVAIAMLALAMQPAAAPIDASPARWLALFGKEAFIGATIGFFFAGLLWAFEAAGQLIDAKVGTTQAQVTDPMSGQQVTLNGAFLGRLAGWVFMAGGGFMVLIGTLLESYATWPVREPLGGLAAEGARLFQAEFGRIMALTLLVAAPALVLLYLVDAVLGLVNRFAQQLNVYALAAPLKALVATWILLVQAGLLVTMLADALPGRGGIVTDVLRRLLG